MITIQDASEIEALRNQRALVTIYLDRGYFSGVTDHILSIRQAFDRNVGEAWHFLIPTIRGEITPQAITSQEYGIELARVISFAAKIYSDEMPVILFKEWTLDRSYYLRFGSGASRDDISRTISRVTDILERALYYGRSDPDEFRFDIIDEIRRDDRFRAWIGVVRQRTGHLLTGAGIAASFF